VLEPPVYQAVRRLARRDGTSVSTKVRDLLRHALDVEEDAALGALAEEREVTFDRRKALTHQEVWATRRTR
jgi:plasmid stability protein